MIINIYYVSFFLISAAYIQNYKLLRDLYVSLFLIKFIKLFLVHKFF